MIGPPPSKVEEFDFSWKKWIHNLWAWIKDEYIATGSLSLTSDGIATSTVVTEAACTTTSRIVMFPTTTAAASGVASTFISAKSAGSFTITHGTSASSRTFDYILVNE